MSFSFNKLIFRSGVPLIDYGFYLYLFIYNLYFNLVTRLQILKNVEKPVEKKRGTCDIQHHNRLVCSTMLISYN